MRSELATSEVPRVPFYRDPRIRALFYQLLVVLFVVGGTAILIHNTLLNLARLGVASGFGFLARPSGFDIGQHLIDYSAQSTFGRAFLVGFINTIIVAILGIVLATIIGFLMGIARLSHNWLVSSLATVYIEVVRNIPLLLQLLLYYAIIVHALPQPRESATLFDAILLNTGGLFLPRPLPQPGFWLWVAIVVLALLAIPVVMKLSTRRRELTGHALPTTPIVIGLLLLIPAGYFLTGRPLAFDYPQMGRFRPSGGLVVQPEFVALVVGLAIYTGSFIAEIVRSGILSVSKGQWEAALSLGLSRGRTLRLIVVPQALRVIIPPQTNQYLNLTKNSSLAVAIGYPDFFNIAGTINNQTGQAVEVVAITMGVYLVLSLLTSVFMNWYNARMALVER
ncbi:amino acid ABC transporter permease [Benzoatithermus flavus]|uniref:Amino acid ABC transporter permease n=1 Tax=Benzoatithermus flavus TaxID=3108223 RepID=A0ABU8XRC8_9PROT